MRPELRPKTVSDQLVITHNTFKTVGHPQVPIGLNGAGWKNSHQAISTLTKNFHEIVTIDSNFTVQISLGNGLLTHFVDAVAIYVSVLDYIFTADDVLKFLFATPRWIEGTEECVTGFVCDCYGNAVVRHNPPLLFNIAKDPSERIPLDITTQDHKHLLQEINNFIAEHNTELYKEPPENQFAWRRLMPVPWLQPCCNFPYCHCTDPVYP